MSGRPHYIAELFQENFSVLVGGNLNNDTRLKNGKETILFLETISVGNAQSDHVFLSEIRAKNANELFETEMKLGIDAEVDDKIVQPNETKTHNLIGVFNGKMINLSRLTELENKKKIVKFALFLFARNLAWLMAKGGLENVAIRDDEKPTINMVASQLIKDFENNDDLITEFCNYFKIIRLTTDDLNNQVGEPIQKLNLSDERFDYHFFLTDQPIVAYDKNGNPMSYNLDPKASTVAEIEVQKKSIFEKLINAEYITMAFHPNYLLVFSRKVTLTWVKREEGPLRIMTLITEYDISKDYKLIAMRALLYQLGLYSRFLVIPDPNNDAVFLSEMAKRNNWSQSVFFIANKGKNRRIATDVVKENRIMDEGVKELIKFSQLQSGN